MKKILFLLGSADISGGTYVIFQHALYLKSRGYPVTIALVYMTMNDFVHLKNSDKCWHNAIKELNFIHIEQAKSEHYNLVIFTWWATLYSLNKISADNYLYFVQSIESRFYPQGDQFAKELVNRTYQLGLPVITEATWIKNYLSENYKNSCSLVKNGILKTTYTPAGEVYAAKPQVGLRILVEGPIEPFYKNIKRTIELCKTANVGEIWWLTSSNIQSYPGVDRTFSQVPVDQVPKIYRSCDVLVKLSYVEGMFGPPLEMFHCGGTAIVYDVTGYDEYIVDQYNAIVVKTDDHAAVIKSLQQLSQDKLLLNQLKSGALETANLWIDWQESSAKFETVIKQYLQKSLTPLQKKAINNNFNKFFKELISVSIHENKKILNSKMTAEPLHDNGYYQLIIPVNRLIEKIEIHLGKSYSYFALTKLNFYKKDLSTADRVIYNEPSLVQFTAEGMTGDRNNIFNCPSQDGSLIITINPEKLNFIHNQYQLQIEFRPAKLADVVCCEVNLA